MGAITFSREEQINALLKDIRECKVDCQEVKVKRMPVVFSAKDPRVLIVSEVPPFGEWKKGLGKKWIDTLAIPIRGPSTSGTLIKWLSIPDRQFTIEHAEKLFFWIQRSNCNLEDGTKDKVPNKVRNRVYQRCSNTYFERAIDTVKPRIILSLGIHGSWWFNPGKKLVEVVGKEEDNTYKGYDYFALAHPSQRSTWPAEHPKEHKRSLELVRPIIAELIQGL